MINKNLLVADWFENESGERWMPPELNMARPSSYNLHHHIDWNISEHKILSGTSVVAAIRETWNEELVLELHNLGYTLKQAIIFNMLACERCINIMGYALGLKWGYSPTSEEAKKVKTICTFCKGR